MIVTIAHYRRGSALARAVILIAIIAGAYGLTLFGATGQAVAQFLSGRPLLFPLAIVGWVAALPVLWSGLVMIRLVIFEDGRALWLEDGKVVYGSRLNLSVDRSSIVGVCSGISERSGRQCVYLHMDNGAKKVIPTQLMEESMDTIVANLRNHIS